MIKKIELAIFVFILILAFVLRLYRFDNPIGDWHAFRQADTSAVAKVYVSNGINLLSPKYFDISNIQSGKDNPEGYRFVEFPVMSAIQASTFMYIGVLSLEEWGRLITILSSLGSLTFIYLLVRRHLDPVSGLFSAFFYAILPYSIFYGRVILPDPACACAILGGIYFFDVAMSYKKHKMLLLNIFFWLALVFTAISFLLKPFALFFTLPMFILAWKRYGFRVFLRWELYIFAFLSILPLVLWRIWITQHPEGIPVSNWLFNEGGIRFTGAFFHWILAERVAKLILGYFGIVLLLLGLFKRNEKNYLFFLSFLVSSIIYVIVIARGNVQHDYYQILILPTICIFLGRGATYLLSIPVKTGENIGINTFISLFTLTVIIILSFMLSWYHVRDYFNINNRGLINAGIVADKLLPKNAKVIAANDGDTSFLYYINRKGWPAYEKSVEGLQELGATHIVVPSPTENDIKGLGTIYKRLYTSKDVLILKL
jgi:4-amino-4-deoxy-L-arabinose transferase-like glycosyltransferase